MTKKRGRKKTSVTLKKLPAKFLELCDAIDMTPEDLLESFIADLIYPHTEECEKDGYVPNGSDECDLAVQYLLRCGYSRDRRTADLRDPPEWWTRWWH